ncbi:GDYXXLXY domain-containing protein [Numidum massiliense]|uniref:GDYXXLXY domain-containing protein n=1 Tax=Numidum massiliense TaxID=1522315 RepID=UPI0006D575A8|nr:GDYXXLXY domain-containing protein [Numidum massiliense]
MEERRAHTTYLLGLIFLVAAIIYFFATNWPLMDRPTKILLSLLLIVCGYLAAWVYERTNDMRYLSRWWLVFATISFGVSVALLGQMYNSHADSYVLFLIWLVPALVMALWTRYTPFYWLSLLLLECTIWLKVYPSGFFFIYDIWEDTYIFSAIVLFHLLLYYGSQRVQLQHISHVLLAVAQLSIVSRLVKHPFYDVLANWEGSFATPDQFAQTIFPLFHLLYIAVMVLIARHLFRTKNFHPLVFAVHLLFFDVYVVYNVFYIFYQFFGDSLFLRILMLVVLFTLSRFSLKVLNRTKSTKSQGQSNKWVNATYYFFVTVFSLLGTIVALLIIAAFILLFLGADNLSMFFLLLGIVSISGSLLITHPLLTVVRATLAASGSCLLYLYALEFSVISYLVTVVIFAAFSLAILKYKWAVIFYVANQWTLIKFIYSLFITINVPLVIADLCVIALVAWNVFICYKFHTMSLRLVAYVLSVAMLFDLAFLSFQPSLWLTVVYRLLAVAFLLWQLYKPFTASRMLRWFTWAALATFIMWMYYEYLWSLLHKSLTLLLLSAICFALFFILNKKKNTAVTVARIRWWGIVAVLVAQLVFVGVTVYQKETLLKEGTSIALKLAPVDPRSMFQGDYVNLSYDLGRALPYFNENGAVHVMLTADDAQSVRYNGEYIPLYTGSAIIPRAKWRKGYNVRAERQGGDDDDAPIFLRGEIKHGQLVLGIEHFFVPEGTGRKWEQMNVAIVKVAKNGDALLETLVRYPLP